MVLKYVFFPNQDEFGQKVYKDNAEQLHKVNGLGAQTILGQQESSGEFHSKKPYGILPIHSDKWITMNHFNIWDVWTNETERLTISYV